MDKRLANRVLKFFDEEDVKIIAQTATDLGTISKDTIDGLIEEFGRALKRGADLTATSDKLQGLLAGVMTPEQITALLGQTNKKSGHGVWQQLQKINEMALGQYLAKQHPQVVALVLSRADAVTSAALLKTLPRSLSQEIVQRMLALRSITEAPLNLLEKSLLEDLLVARRDTDVSPHTRMAQIFNKMDRKVMEESLKAIASYNEKDAEQIRQLLFTFEDLGKLSTPALVMVMDTIQPDMIIQALYGVQNPLKEQILQAVPSRARRSLEVELESGAAPNTRKTAKAQRAMADIALELIERGVIEVGGEDEVEDVLI
jgi:flagellar motor switch protein FliG